VTKENGGVYDYPSGELNDTCAYVIRGGGWLNNPCQYGDKNFMCENRGKHLMKFKNKYSYVQKFDSQKY
jgi:hypothetical protein